MNDYIVLDIESPNTLTRSVSAIGIVIIRDNKIVDTIYSLINPEDFFEDEIISLTGITPDMVKDAPKFNEYWKEIEKLLLNNPIIGHNIKYDLTVISRSLYKYGINIPQFEYICTLNLSRKYLKLNSYALTSIMSDLNITYEAHNALADAEVTFYLFQYLEKIKEQTILDTHKFHLKTNAKKEINDYITPNKNELYGLLQELMYKEEITDKHLNLIKKWISNNSKNKKYIEISNITKKLEFFINKKDITKKDLNRLTVLITSVSKSEKYSREELNYQILTGILEMVYCDDKICQNEYNYLEKWLNYYELPIEVNKKEIMSSLTVK